MARVAPATSRRTWRDVGLSLVLAAGLSTAFLGPWQFGQSTGGRILGETVTKPLNVQVTTLQGVARQDVRVDVTNGTLSEALGKAAAAWHGAFTYTSRGNAIYIQQFLSLPNDQTGQWRVDVNGLPVTDLTAVALLQGDHITLTRLTTL